MSASGIRWSSKDSQWLRPIMEAFADERVRNITCMCSAQSAKTQTVLALLCYIIAEDPGPILWVTANEDEAKKLSKSRLMDMLKKCAPVAKKLPQDRNKTLTTEIYFDGAPLIIASAQNEAALQSTPFKYVFLDEARSYPAGALGMVEKRTRSYAYSFKKVVISTPGDEGDAMHREYLKGNQQVYHITCPNPTCQHEQPLEWKDKDEPGGIKWDTNDLTRPEGKSYAYDELAKTIRWECERCGHKVHDTPTERKKLSNSGRWIALNPVAPRDTVSFHWNALLPYWAAWDNQVKEYLDGVRALKWGDPEPLRKMVTETKGLPWTDKLRYAKDEKFIYHRQAKYDPRAKWDEEERRIVTIDVQGKGGRHYWVCIRAWARGAKSRLLYYDRVWTVEEWKQICAEYNVLDDNVVIDTGKWAQELYPIIMASGYHYKAMKGEDQDYFTKQNRRSIWNETMVDPAIGTASQGRVRPLKLFLYAKYSCLDRLAMMQHGDLGDWVWPAPDPDNGISGVNREYALQVTAYEKRERTRARDGSTYLEWHQKRPDDHASSCEIMQIAAASRLGFLLDSDGQKAEP